jgi:hypothetical protein
MSRELYEPAPTRRIDYERMNREFPAVKAALTRAERQDEIRRPLAVVKACERFVELSERCGAMPDDWARWRNALEDAYRTFQRSEAGDTDYYIMRRFQAVARRFDF